MKTLIKISLALFCLTALFSCGDNSVTGSKVASVGGPYELIVIAAQDKWDSPLGDTLRSILLEPVSGLNQMEPAFDVSRIVPNSFSGLLQKSRNVLNVVTSSDYAQPAMLAQYNVYASPQLIVTLSGANNAEVTEFVSQHRSELLAVFDKAERERALELNARYGEKKLEKEILDKFGFRMNLTKGYTLRNELDNFMWISFEYPTASQGIVIYSYPYSGKENFSADSLVARRNEFVSNIPGENPGSHMITLQEFTPELKHLRINGRYWAEMKGFWDVYKDYMGGPFVSYSTLDTDNMRVISIDFYVYSPDKPKRNFMRGLEHLIYSVSFPSDEQQRQAQQ